MKFARSLDKPFVTTNRLRIEGTDVLIAAARKAGVRKFIAQSYAPLRYAREGGPVKTEDDPLEPTPPANTQETHAAITCERRPRSAATALPPARPLSRAGVLGAVTAGAAVLSCGCR